MSNERGFMFIHKYGNKEDPLVLLDEEYREIELV
jgi:hypothetical protein